MTLNQAFTWRSRLNKFITNSMFALSSVSKEENIFGGNTAFEKQLTADEIEHQLKKVDDKKVKVFLVNGLNFFVEEYDKVKKLAEFSLKLQDAIDDANISSGALSIIHKIQELQILLKIVEPRSGDISELPHQQVEEKKVFYEREYNPDTKALGAYRYVYSFPVSEAGNRIAWDKRKADITKEIRDLTDKLSEINGSTLISNKFFTDEEFEEVKSLI